MCELALHPVSTDIDGDSPQEMEVGRGRGGGGAEDGREGGWGEMVEGDVAVIHLSTCAVRVFPLKRFTNVKPFEAF